jgi:hypothetical protein
VTVQVSAELSAALDPVHCHDASVTYFVVTLADLSSSRENQDRPPSVLR